MVNILLNDLNFDAKWAYPSLQPYLTKDSHVFVMPLNASEGWSNDELEWEHQYQKGGRLYEKIIQGFRNYLIGEENVKFFNHQQDSKIQFEKNLETADILYLYGDDGEHMMMRLEDLGLLETIRQYDGIIMSNHAGSNLVMETFDSTYEWEEEEITGLGILSGFALMPDYVEDAAHLARLIRHIEIHGKAVFAFGKDGGVIIDHGRYELLGNAFTASDQDLDAIYSAYEDAKSRQDYYGDNGLW